MEREMEREMEIEMDREKWRERDGERVPGIGDRQRWHHRQRRGPSRAGCMVKLEKIDRIVVLYDRKIPLRLKAKVYEAIIRTEQNRNFIRQNMNYIGFSCHTSSDKENTYKNINYKNTKTTK